MNRTSASPNPQRYLALVPRTRFSVAGKTLELDDLHHKLVIDQRVPRLGHTDYLLVRALLQGLLQHKAGRSKTSTVSIEALQQMSNIRSQGALHQHISQVRPVFGLVGLQIKNVHGEGYFLEELDPSSEV